MSIPRHRILFVAHSSHRGGAEYCLDTTLRHLDRSRFDPLVSFPFDGPLAESTRELGIETVVMPMCHWLYFKKNAWYWRNLLMRSTGNVRRFSRLIRERKVDLVYTNTTAIFESARAARKSKVPHLWHVHEVLKPGNEMSQLLPIAWMQRFIRRHADQIVFESNSAKAAFEETTPVPEAAVVYNSIRLNCKLPSESEKRIARASFGVSVEAFVVVFVGQFIDRKNPLLLVDAIKKATADRRIECLFVGAGPLEQEMRDRIAILGLTDRCKIVPFQDDIAPVMSVADVLVLPSRQESFGLVLVEAAAFKKPVVACRCQGPCEIVVHGETGFLTDQEDANQIAERLSQLARSPKTALAMGEAGFLRNESLFSPVGNTQRLQALMVRLLEPSPA